MEKSLDSKEFFMWEKMWTKNMVLNRENREIFFPPEQTSLNGFSTAICLKASAVVDCVYVGSDISNGGRSVRVGLYKVFHFSDGREDR